jgi:S1-C subfamily serine protease
MRAHPPAAAHGPGIDVQPLTPPLAIAGGAESGVVVTWVDPSSTAAHEIRAGDVIVGIDDVAVRNIEQWRVRMARVAPGDAPVIHVSRGGVVRDIPLNSPALPPAASAPRLGLSMRPVALLGVEVVHVEPGSAAAAADIRAGDLVTAVGAISAPTAGEVRSAFASAAPGDIVIVAVTRGATHHVMGLKR